MIRLVQTCFACPEQYDAFDGDTQVGYLRLRHGKFRVDAPDCGGETIYQAAPKGDGCFEPDERDYYFRLAVDAIQRWIAGERREHLQPPDVQPPDVQYEITT